MVEPYPSVIESPSAMTAPVGIAASTSMPDNTYRDLAVVAPGRVRAAVESPGGEMNVVCIPNWCHVKCPVATGKYMLIASSVKGATFSSTGSLSANAPGGIVTDFLPLNVSVRSESAMIEAPLPCEATCSAPISSGLSP
jgi:hypothetical protein